tara:strand:+ start:456 stop:1058 length:603 start_codon:yes stop_codon:yes gene_type:complete
MILRSIYLLGIASLIIFTPKTTYLIPNELAKIFSLVLFNILFYISLIDIKSLIISSLALKIGFLAGFTMFLLNINYLEFNSTIRLFFDLLFSSTCSFLIIFFVNQIGESLTGENLVGIGDAKLASMCALWIGGRGVFSSLLLAFFAAGTFSFCRLFTKKVKRFEPIPFAPFISGGVWCIWITGSNWWWIKLQDLFGYLMV